MREIKYKNVFTAQKMKFVTIKGFELTISEVAAGIGVALIAIETFANRLMTLNGTLRIEAARTDTGSLHL